MADPPSALVSVFCRRRLDDLAQRRPVRRTQQEVVCALRGGAGYQKVAGR
ncbi:hypothetical protein AGRA3207_007502 [Actinomadura graeca]|uniref:Transposase n=1 Tax=Actinomadura graeca TaxID=2750812 RepID=A0ABX8R522_9ACTN|nr:hypothetical protein [Actinomadura graeca]QXJ25933.1 hypothetical protein AGRA3207_007502 [Actinomadura graeca]